jgi:hypothetical protein
MTTKDHLSTTDDNGVVPSETKGSDPQGPVPALSAPEGGRSPTRPSTSAVCDGEGADLKPFLIDHASREVVRRISGPSCDARFPALSAYVCPECDLVLKAAFLIEIPLPAIGLRFSNPAGRNLSYESWHAAGVQVIAVKRGHAGPCRYSAYTAPFTRESLSDLVFDQTGFRVTPSAIDPTKLLTVGDALMLLGDSLGNGKPIVLFDPVVFRSTIPGAPDDNKVRDRLLEAIGILPAVGRR